MNFFLPVSKLISFKKKKPTTANQETAMNRIYFLDGIRGWAAIIVVLFHFFVFRFPIAPAASKFMKKIFFLNGGMAVYIFFITSGFSLTIGYFKKQNPLILKKILAGRYIRLIIPIGIASLMYFIALKTKLIPPLALRPEKFRSFLVEVPNFFDFCRFHFFQVLYHYDKKQSLIPPLWTMQIEFLGSIFVLCSLLVIDKLKFKPVFILIFSIIAMQWNILYSLFFIGVMLAWVYSKYPSVNNTFIGYLTLFLALLSSWFFDHHFHSQISFSFIFKVFCLLNFFIAAMYCKPVQNFLSSPLSIYLGKISFSLYLIHSLVIWTVGLRLMNSIDNLWIDCIGVLISLILAHYLTYVDAVGIKLSHQVGDLVSKLEIHKKNNTILPSNAS
ncbi:Acyltransferase family [Legionella wadsworthii]|uniref:Acyltransferase family n=1 Tax=Legionella wadsworthii TaxID=28088 RepID=A0A378LM70_9GAMM|nr:acyltransferase [Legionella wadsworthii]STY28006.1 Acyltransferase family [Legionella wadsworthii]